MDCSSSPTELTQRIAVATLLLLWLCPGCSVLGRFLDVVPREADRSPMRIIAPIQPEQFSESAPISVESSAPTIGQRVRGKPTPPEQLTLTLADVRAAALLNNLDLEVELLNPEIAQEDVPIEEGRFDALLGVSINRTHLDVPTVTLPGLPPTPLPQFDSRLYEPQLVLPSRTGGTLTVDRLARREQNQGSPALYESDWRFSISQPLLRNAGIRVNTAPIRIAKYTTLQTDATTRLQVISVLAAADRQYWRVWSARKELEVRQQQYDLAMRQLVDVRKFVAADAKPEFETTRAEAGLAQRVQGIILAQANLQLAERELKRIMNRPDVPLESDTTFELATEPQPVGLELDENALSAMALENRPELAIQNYQLAVDDLNIDVARNSRWPLTTLDASSTLNGVGSTFGQAHDVLNSGRFADYGVGLNVTFPLPNQSARAQYRQSRLERAQTVAIRRQLEQRINQEVYDAVTVFEQSWQLILAARNNVRYATLDLDVERKLFDAGEQNRTTTEVLNAAARLADAQSTEVRAIAAHQISLIDVAFATGTLLGYGRVRWHANPACRYSSEGQPIGLSHKPSENGIPDPRPEILPAPTPSPPTPSDP